MAGMKWSPEQELAINEDGKNIIVSAGAGSGKTAVLTARVIRKLKSGVHINELLVLGFVGWSVYSDHLEAILGLAAIDNNFAVMIEFGKLIVEFIYKACIAFLVIAAADYGVTKWKFLKDQKMQK